MTHAVQVALRVTRCGKDHDMVQNLQSLLEDALVLLPTSSVSVERLHANVQQNTGVVKSEGRKQHVLQVNSYLLSAFLEHSRIRAEVEREAFGKSKIAAGKLLAKRIVRTTLPARPSSSIRELAMSSKVRAS